MDKRYQVFVSSTYEDLKAERQKVIQLLLEFDCIPVGMEFFPAADDSAWEVIQRVIEECDYYVVIVAGRYGSLSPEGISYTQKEYEYAVKCGVPVMSFLHGDTGKIPAEKTEGKEKAKKKLEEFRKLCKARLCKYWTTPDELAGAVVTSLNKLKKTQPRVGWVRADKLADEVATQEILQLRKTIDSLQEKLQQRKEEPSPGTEGLSQGDDVFQFPFTAQGVLNDKAKAGAKTERLCALTWNQLLSIIGEKLIGASTPDGVESVICNHIWRDRRNLVGENLKPLSPSHIHIYEGVVMTIILQFRSLGIVEEFYFDDTRKKPTWRLTEYGDSLFTRVRAIKKPTA